MRTVDGVSMFPPAESSLALSISSMASAVSDVWADWSAVRIDGFRPARASLFPDSSLNGRCDSGVSASGEPLSDWRVSSSAMIGTSSVLFLPRALLNPMGRWVGVCGGSESNSASGTTSRGMMKAFLLGLDASIGALSIE